MGRVARSRPDHTPSRVAALSRGFAGRREEEAWERFRLATLRHHEEQVFESLEAAFDACSEWEATWE